MSVGDELVVRPGRRRVRVRAIQSLYATQPSVGPGHRTALNLVGVNHGDVGRGHAVVRPDQWHLTGTVDASLRVLASLDHDVSRRGAYVAYLGAGEFSVRMRILGSESLRPGAQGSVRLHLPRRLPLLPGDRFVLRESGRAETVGGGEILDVDPRLPAALARPDRSVDRVVAERGWVRPEDLWRLTGERREPTLAGWVVDPAALATAQEDLRTRIAEASDLGLDLAVLGERERAVAEHLDSAVIEAGRVHPARRVDTLTGHPFLAALEENPFSPPEPSSPGAPPVEAEELREMLRRKLVVSSDGVVFAASAVGRAAEIVVELLAGRPGGFTVAEFRDATGTTRKYALPLLAALDAGGMTRRRGDLRIAGRRLPGRGGNRVVGRRRRLRVAAPTAGQGCRDRGGGSGRSPLEGDGVQRSRRRSCSLRPPQMPCGSRMRRA